MGTDIIVIKIGGRVIEEAEILHPLIDDILESKNEFGIILIHGGGNEVSRLTAKFGFNPLFEKGIRITGHDEIEIVNMVLSGKINKYIVRCFNKKNPESIGISGQDARIFTGERLNKNTSTGKITNIDTSLLTILIEKGLIPVISSVSMDNEGLPLNINADEAAFKIAETIKAKKLLFISDIPGILKNGELIKTADEKIIKDETVSGIITDGMIPKTNMSIKALKNGVGNIIIGQYSRKGELLSLLSGKTGTSIKL